MTSLRPAYPLYLANEAQQPNTSLVVTDKFTGKAGDAGRPGRREDDRRGHCGGGGGRGAHGANGGLRAPGRPGALRDSIPGTRRRAGLCAVHRGGQADPRLPRRSRPPDRHVPHRRRRIGAHHRRGPAPRHQSARAGLPGHVEARADRALLVHLAVQFPAQSRGAQDRAGAGGGLPVRDEARVAHAARRDHHRRGAGRDRPAEGRVLDPAGDARRGRPVHHRRAPEAPVLHRLARRRLGPRRRAPARRRSCSSSAAMPP